MSGATVGTVTHEHDGDARKPVTLNLDLPP